MRARTHQVTFAILAASATVTAPMARAQENAGASPSAHVGAHFGGRFVDDDDKRFLGTPPLLGLTLGGWYAVSRRSSLGLHLEANVSFAEKNLDPVLNTNDSKAVTTGFDVPALIQYGYRPVSWFRAALGAGAFWRYQRAYIDNPKSIGDDYFANRYVGATGRFALEFPSSVGSTELVPTAALAYLNGSSSEKRRLRYDNRDFAFGGSEWAFTIGIAVSTPSSHGVDTGVDTGTESEAPQPLPVDAQNSKPSIPESVPSQENTTGTDDQPPSTPDSTDAPPNPETPAPSTP
jgi:hypothetical protein